MFIKVKELNNDLTLNFIVLIKLMNPYYLSKQKITHNRARYLDDLGIKKNRKRVTLKIVVLLLVLCLILSVTTNFFENDNRKIVASSSADLNDQIEQFNKEINSKKEEIAELKDKQAEYEYEIEQKQKEAATLENQIEIFNIQILSFEEKIKTTEIQIETANLEISKVTGEIEKKEQDIDKQKQTLSTLLRAVYEYSEVSPLEILLGNNKLSDFVNQLTYISDIQASLNDQLKTVKDMKNDLEARKAQIEAKRAELQQLKDDLDGQRRTLDAQKLGRQTILSRTQALESEYQSLLGALKAEEESVNQQIVQFVQQKQKVLSDAEKQAAEANRKEATTGGGSGYFAQPFKGSYPITANYGVIYCPFGNCTYHWGVDFGMSQGTNLYSAGDGVVEKVSAAPAGTSQLNYIMIYHSDLNIYTLYLHLSAFKVTTGQTVKKGQLVAKSGGAFGTWGAGYSTGPHLHFEMRDASTGKTINPHTYITF